MSPLWPSLDTKEVSIRGGKKSEEVTKKIPELKKERGEERKEKASLASSRYVDMPLLMKDRIA